jgi:NADH-quinone oxidoreductase subunit N
MPWGLLAPELGLCLWILVMLLADLAPATRKPQLSWLALGGIGFTAVLLAWQQPLWARGESFQSMLAVTHFSGLYKCFFTATAAVVVIMTRQFQRHLPAHLGAFYMLLFTALLGTFVLASMRDLLMLFLGLELLTFSLYIMAAYLKAEAKSIEAGMKYLILGSVSSGFLVYGIALLYGFAGGTSFTQVQNAFTYALTVPATAYAGMVLVLAGLGFKIAASPFNLWVPDVYEGAPTPVVALLSVGSKMAGAMALLQLLTGIFAPIAAFWMPLLAALSVATLLYGNLGALAQTNIKRLLGYSSIGHAGYLLMGLSTGSVAGAEAVTYYLLAYLFSTLAVFLVVIAASDAVGGDALEDYRGLSQRSGFLAAVMFLGLLSLAGVPPLAGFVGKLLVLLATVESGRLWLVAVGAVNVAIALYYYLLIVKRMYLDAPRQTQPIAVPAATRVTLYVLVLGILVVGIWQAPFLRWISAIR